MIQFEYFNYKLKQNSATKIKQTVGAITPPDGYAFGVLSALTNLETVSSTLITGYNAVFIHTLNSQVPTESAVNAFVTDVASGKVDKTNVAYRLYGTDADGNQTTFPIGVNNLRDVQVDGVSVVDTDGIANIDLTGYLQKTGGTLTGDLAFQYNTNNPKLRIIQSGQNTNHLRFINNNYASQSISFDLSQAAIHPLVTGRGHLGTSDIHFGDAHIDKVYTPIINNGYDIAVPVTNSADTLALKSEVDLAANSGRMITDQGVWYAKMYSATVAPSAENGTNYADFSQTDGQGNPIIVIYERQSGAWAQSETITPPAEYDGYVPITSKIWDIPEQAGQQGGRILWNHQSKEFTPYPHIVSFEDAALTGTPTAPTLNASSPNDQIVNKQTLENALVNHGTGRNVGDIFYTMRNDNELNGAIECNGAIYDTTDFTGAQSIGSLLAAGKVPYVSLSQYATALTTNGSVGVFGWDGGNTTTFRVPSLNDIFVETGTAAQIGDFVPAGLPDHTHQAPYGKNDTGNSHAVGTDSPHPATSEKYSTIQGYGLNSTLASASNSTYGNSNTVQPKSVRYRAMAQLATSASDEAVETCTSVMAQVAANTTAIAGADYVVESQLPTANNNYTWYRKYKSGWVEQGGRQTGTSTGSATITLPTEMADTNYNIQASSSDKSLFASAWIASTTQITLETRGHDYSQQPCRCFWQVSGMAAS